MIVFGSYFSCTKHLAKRNEVRTMVNSLHSFLIVVLSGPFLLGYAEKTSSSEDTVKDGRKPVLLEDIPATAAFIGAAEVSVIGFFQDSEQPEVLNFLTLTEDIQDIPFGICTSPQVLSHYNITRNTISLFRTNLHNRLVHFPAVPTVTCTANSSWFILKLELHKLYGHYVLYGEFSWHGPMETKDPLSKETLEKELMPYLSLFSSTRRSPNQDNKVDNKRQDLEIQDSNKIDVEKLSRFIRINELRWVTEYNPMTAIGLFDSTVQTHLLLFSDKTSPKHLERVNKYREAAVSFQEKILFILVDINAKGNDRVLSYFRLKKSQLPALAAYSTPDEEKDVLPLDEVSLENIKDFCTAFLERKEGKKDPEQEDKPFREEL